MENNGVFYDQFLDVFELRKCGMHNVVDKKEGNYGIEFHYDINANLVAIIIPDPSTLWGIDKDTLVQFTNNNIFT